MITKEQLIQDLRDGAILHRSDGGDHLGVI